MNRLSTEKRAAILRSLVDGASVSATARVVGVSKVTVLKLLADVGAVCADYQRQALSDLPCRFVECDEIWSFVGAKDRNVPRDEKGRGRGDVWTWTAICADTKVIPCWHLDTRDANAAALFMEDLASRLAHRVQLTTDGHKAYLRAVEGAFGWNGVDYAMLVKVYGPAPEGQGRYSPPQIIDTQAQWVMGDPDAARNSTSYAERQNLTMRMNMRRFTRLTNASSKKMEHHAHALAFYFMHYNFCRPHQTLTKAKGGIKQTPAMAAGVADHLWTMEEVVGLLGGK